MIKIRFFFLSSLFLLTPLMYAWLYIPGIGFDLSTLMKYIFPWFSWSGFESVKVDFLLFCTGWALISHLFHLLSQKKLPQLSHTFLVALSVFFVWTVISLWLNQDVNLYFVSGNPEKTHGWFFYTALFTLFFIIRSLSPSEKKHLLMLTFISFGWVTLYTIFQRIGLDPLAPFYETRLDMNRVFSTLWNPNYLAWFVLMLLPLLHENIFTKNGKYKTLLYISLWILGGILIYWTGSYLAWIFFFLYVSAVLVSHIISNKNARFLFWIIVSLLVFVSLLFVWSKYSQDILEMQKMKGFIARWYLWKTGIAALTHDAGHFLFWYGPDGFLPVSENFRHPLLSVYEDPAYRIGRSHNVFLDFALHFGVLLLLTLLILVFKNLKNLSHGKKVSLLLFALYFSFNIPVTVHFLLVTIILASSEKKRIIQR